MLVDPNHTRTAGSVISDWYKISTTSPAINKAMSITEVSVDYWNQPRNTLPDMGADEVSP